MKIKNWIKKILCRHRSCALLRWHRLHEPGGPEPMIEAEYICCHCHEKFYRYFTNKNYTKFIALHGYSKMEGHKEDNDKDN